MTERRNEARAGESVAEVGSTRRAVCALRDIPDEGCLAVANGQVLLAAVGGEVMAYRNRCLHKGGRLDTGLIRDGYLVCPEHFWRYRLADGRKVGGDVGLEPVPVAVLDGEVYVAAPEPQPASIREMMLEHARTWNGGGD